MHRTRFAPTLPHRRARLRTVVFTNDMPTLRMLTNHDSVASSSSDIEYAATRDFATQPQLMISQRSALAHVLLCVSGSSTPWHLSTIAFLSRSLDCLQYWLHGEYHSPLLRNCTKYPVSNPLLLLPFAPALVDHFSLGFFPSLSRPHRHPPAKRTLGSQHHTATPSCIAPCARR
jgi:hypothetical protein